MLAYVQSLHYRNFERDYAAALGAAQQALELQQKSGVTENIDLAWSSVASEQMDGVPKLEGSHGRRAK